MMDSTEDQQQATESGTTLFFYRSPRKVALFTLITLQLYAIYWGYAHWRMIRDSSDTKVRPMLFGFFIVFTCFNLFKRIRDTARAKGYESRLDIGVVAAIFAASMVATGVLARIPPRSVMGDAILWGAILLFTGITSFAMYKVQQTAHFSNQKSFPVGYESPLRKKNEAVWVVIGVVIFVLGLASSTYNAVNNTYHQGDSREISAKRAEVQRLTDQYNACSTTLKPKLEALDRSDQQAVDAYNAEWNTCEAVRTAQNRAVDELNKLTGEDL